MSFRKYLEEATVKDDYDYSVFASSLRGNYIKLVDDKEYSLNADNMASSMWRAEIRWDKRHVKLFIQYNFEGKYIIIEDANQMVSKKYKVRKWDHVLDIKNKGSMAIPENFKSYIVKFVKSLTFKKIVERMYEGK